MSRRSTLALTVVVSGLVAGLVAAGCGSDDAPVPVEATDGAELFALRALGGQPGCVTCHSRSPGVVLVGPSLADPVASAAAAGETDVAAYVRTSIVDPGSYIVPGFGDSKRMPDVFGEVLRPDQVDALVEFLIEEATP